VDNAQAFRRLFKTTQPDILLMDIDLGEAETGIDLVRQLNEEADVPVIYLTSFKDEVIFQEAKETLPEAYLNKPYTRESLQAAIELAIFRKQKEPVYRWKKSRQPGLSDAVFVKEGNHLVRMKLGDISLLEAYDKYCYVYSGEKKHLLNLQLKKLLENLPAEQFMQVHRSYVVRLEAITGIRLGENTLEVGSKLVPVSKTYKEGLFSKLKML
jgi:DNA-binding LytR/AlgR family response regulator